MSAPAATLTDLRLRRLLARGPTPDDYGMLTDLVRELLTIRGAGTDVPLSRHERGELHAILGNRLTNTGTLFGHCLVKPHGYAGDFEIIDRIHTRFISDDPVCGRWDRYFQSTPGPRAVRNRKQYFKAIVRDLLARTRGPLRILNVASGPARDVKECLEEIPGARERLRFDCVEMDAKAIAYATELLGSDAENARFFHANALRFRPLGPYDLVWSAGLFDYFDDRTFVRLLRRLAVARKPGAEMIVGNFHPRDPGRPLMVLQDWILNYRTEDELRNLAGAAGENTEVRVEQEPEGVNLFLRTRRSC